MGTHVPVVDKPVEIVDSHRQLSALPADRAGTAGSQASRTPELGWCGDPGVLAVRHSVECARAATRVVSPLSRGADGALGGRSGGRPAVEYSRRPTAGQIARVSRMATHSTAAAAGVQVDSGAPRRPPPSAPRTTVPGSHPALRRDPALGFGGPHRIRSDSSRKAYADRAVGADRSPHAVPGCA